MDTSRPETDTSRAPVFAFAAARLALDRPETAASHPFELTLFSSDFALIDVEDRQQSGRIADAAAGLAAPSAGQVRFLDRDWAEMSTLHASAMRGRIGHVFADGNGLDGLGLLDNILLPQLYHTRRAADKLRDEAARLATLFGLPGLPLGKPAAVSPADLQRAACVRAFLGRPQLLILEHPADGGPAQLLEALVNAVRAARDRGAAVLWFTDDRETFTNARVPADLRLRLRNGTLQTMAQRS